MTFYFGKDHAQMICEALELMPCKDELQRAKVHNLIEELRQNGAWFAHVTAQDTVLMKEALATMPTIKGEQIELFCEVKCSVAAMQPEELVLIREVRALDGLSLAKTFYFKVPNEDFDIKAAIKAACIAFLSTEDGRKICENDRNEFSWHMFMEYVPNSICRRYGFEMVTLNMPAVHVDLYNGPVSKATVPIIGQLSSFASANVDICDVMIKFTTTNVDGEDITIQMSAGDLYDDWYCNCDSVPENGAFLHSLEISAHGKIMTFSREELGEFTFEELMWLIEDIW